jgi:hypothetical protein
MEHPTVLAVGINGECAGVPTLFLPARFVGKIREEGI